MWCKMDRSHQCDGCMMCESVHKVIGYCDYCGKEIKSGDKHYFYDDMYFCDDERCKESLLRYFEGE